MREWFFLILFTITALNIRQSQYKVNSWNKKLRRVYLQIKELTKKYRAYYSRAPSPAGGGAPQPDDYLIDHSIIIYFLGPNGYLFIAILSKLDNWLEEFSELIEHFGRDKTARQIAQSIREMTGRTKYWWNLWGRIK